MRPFAPKGSLRNQVKILADETIPALQTPFSNEERRARE
jgi:hypothetical protein